jgi:DNA-directed RNA polymerase
VHRKRDVPPPLKPLYDEKRREAGKEVGEEAEDEDGDVDVENMNELGDSEGMADEVDGEEIYAEDGEMDAGESNNAEMSEEERKMQEHLNGSRRKVQWWQMSQDEMAKYQLQADLELNAIDQATEHYRKSLDGILRARQGASLGQTRRILDNWYGPFRDSINAAVRKMQSRTASHTLVQNLKLLSSDKLPVITLHQTLGMLLMSPDGAPFMQVAFAVGRAVQAEINFERMKAEDKQAFRSLLKSKSGITVTVVNMKAKYTLKKHDWDSKTIVQV